MGYLVMDDTKRDRSTDLGRCDAPTELSEVDVTRAVRVDRREGVLDLPHVNKVMAEQIATYSPAANVKTA